MTLVVVGPCKVKREKNFSLLAFILISILDKYFQIMKLIGHKKKLSSYSNAKIFDIRNKRWI